MTRPIDNSDEPRVLLWVFPKDLSIYSLLYSSLSYDFPPGYAPLRHENCQTLDRLELHQKMTLSRPLALNLCLRAMAGDVIAIESPAFYGTLQIIERLGMKALEMAIADFL